MKKNLLSIAGFDPSGGAGGVLDIRVFDSLGFRGTAILTSLTAQNTGKVKKVLPLPASFLERQYRTLAADLQFSGIKVGMSGSPSALKAVVRILRSQPDIPRVVDPVFRASSGMPLLDPKAARRFLEILGGNASLLTPNLEEASVLCGRPVETRENMREAALRIFEASGVPCLVKGGHLRREAEDLLFDGKNVIRFKHPKMKKKVHGTGCFLSSAILAFLARGVGLEEACAKGIDWTLRGVKNAVRAGREGYLFDFPL